MKKVYYMMVTKDELQLPLAVAESAEELARIVGTTANNVRSTASRAKDGKFRSFVRVEVDDDEEEIDEEGERAKMVGAINFMKKWRAICAAEESCRDCPLRYNCNSDVHPDEFTDKQINSLIGEVEMVYERKKQRFGGYKE